MSVFEGLCRPVFCVFCVMMMRSVCMSVSCSFACELCCCVGVLIWIVGFASCVVVTGGRGICLGVFGPGLGEG